MAVSKISDLVTSENSEKLKQHHILYSQHLNLKIQESTKELIHTLEKPKFVEKKLLHWMSNCFAEGLEKTILYLQSYMLQEEVNGNRNFLINLFEKLIEAQYSLRFGFNMDVDNLKLKLLHNFQEIRQASTIFCKVVELETVHEKREEFQSELCDLLKVIDCIKIRNQLVESVPGDIKLYFDDQIKKVIAIIATIDNDCEQIVVYHVISTLEKACRLTVQLMYSFQNQCRLFDAESYKFTINASNSIIDIVAELERFLNNNFDVKSLKPFLIECAVNACTTISNLEDLPQYKEMIPDVKEVIDDLVSKLVGACCQVRRKLENAVKTKKIVQ